VPEEVLVMLPTTGWAIVSPLNKEPWIIPIVKLSRQAAQAELAFIHGTTWRKLYRRGFRAVGVEIVPIRKVGA